MESKKQILLVDDSALIRNSMGKIISSEGYEVTLCENGEQCLKALETKEFSLIVIDIEMPEMNGFEVLEKIRTDNKTQISQIPVIFLSGHDSYENRMKGFDLGGNDFIDKIQDSEDILLSINLILNPPKNFEGFGALIVDDSDIYRNILKILFTREGFEVFEGENGKEGFDVFKKNEKKIDLIITDHNMPIMNGLELTKAIREYSKEPMPIVCLSGDSEKNHSFIYLEAGATDFILKPITNELFKAKIYSHMRSYLFTRTLDGQPIAKYKELLEREKYKKYGKQSEMISVFLKEIEKSQEKLKISTADAQGFVRDSENIQENKYKEDENNKELIRELEANKQKIVEMAKALIKMIVEIENYQGEIASARDIFSSLYNSALRLEAVFGEQKIESSKVRIQEIESTLINLISDLRVLSEEFGQI